MSLAAETAQYAAGFNQGMTEAAQTFSIMIQLLMLTFGIRVVANFPPIQKKLESFDQFNLLVGVRYGADVLAFFITIMIFWSATGRGLVQ